MDEICLGRCFVWCFARSHGRISYRSIPLATMSSMVRKTAKMMQRCVSSRSMALFFFFPLQNPQPGFELANDDTRALTMIGNANICFKNPRIWPGRIQTEVGASETTSTSFLHSTVGCSPKQCLRTFHGVTSTIRSLKCSEITESLNKGMRVSESQM
jgi:hypothetical protein